MMAMNCFLKALTFLTLLVVTVPGIAHAEGSLERLSVEDLIQRFLAESEDDITVSFRKKHDTSFIGTVPEKMDYAALLAVLNATGLTAYRSGSMVHIISNQNARFHPIPVVEEGGQYAPEEFVTETLTLKNVCAVNVLPLLRPLVPKFGHFSAQASSNTIILTDRFANINRIKRIIEGIESRIPSMSCKESGGK